MFIEKFIAKFDFLKKTFNMDSNIVQFIANIFLGNFAIITNAPNNKTLQNELTFIYIVPTKPGNPYYSVLFVNHTKPGIVLIESVPSGEYVYYIF